MKVLGVREIGAGAERGYFKIEDIEACEAAGVTAYLPDPFRSPAVREGFFSKNATPLRGWPRCLCLSGWAALSPRYPGQVARRCGDRLSRPRCLPRLCAEITLYSVILQRLARIPRLRPHTRTSLPARSGPRRILSSPASRRYTRGQGRWAYQGCARLCHCAIAWPRRSCLAALRIYAALARSRPRSRANTRTAQGPHCLVRQPAYAGFHAHHLQQPQATMRLSCAWRSENIARNKGRATETRGSQQSAK
jgi:hypothetical protein